MSGSGSMAVTLRPSLANGTARRPGPQPRSQDRVARLQPGEVRDARDQRLGIGQPIARIERHGGAEAARLESVGGVAHWAIL